ncbi:MFS transporter [Paraburkholderia ginsengiterrae]|uniref:MFS transporter n=1 Tax=Paraburkholderia ginsengiterrae TaxID=1462993 RepID=A0ABX2USM5_9BURK|nr:MFS transporter [Paraburkholderia ginsengiterrae]OAJ56958.1 MFS transporter [Paraburkholderia ginsengiterrae]
MNSSVENPACVVATQEAESPQQLTALLTLFFGTAVGVIVVNLFAAQPLTGSIGRSLHLAPELTGLVAMLPQLGYALGLVLLVPLCDLLENRRLIVRTLACCAGCLAVAMVTDSRGVFLLAIFLAGATSSVIQMLVPMAAAMASESHRGRAVGNVMSGLMLGILLSRPAASVIAGALGWRAFYGLAALIDAVLAVVLYFKLPVRLPVVATRYPALLRSLWTMLRTERVLQRNAASAALGMGAFSAFWTAIGLRLVQPPFSFSLNGIALFAVAGAAGAIVTPLAGRAGDRGAGRAALISGHLTMLAAMVVIGVAGAGWGGFSASHHPALAVALLVAGAAALDAGVVTDQTLGRRAINLMNPAARGRLNGLFVGVFFVGGALGAMLSGAAWSMGGWTGVCVVGFVFSGAAFVLRLVGVGQGD